MDRDLDMLAGPLAARGPVTATPPVLIRVPALANATAATATPRRPSQSFRPRRTRRRLRREVRTAGFALLGSAALALAWPLLRPSPSIANAPAPEATPVSILRPIESLEPSAVAATDPAPEAKAPVIMPGVLVPEDGDEEPDHAGS